MSEHGHCYDCGGHDGNHFDDCTYEGTGCNGGYSSYSRRSGADVSAGTVWGMYILALIIGYGVNELLGTLLLIGLIFWVCVS